MKYTKKAEIRDLELELAKLELPNPDLIKDNSEYLLECEIIFKKRRELKEKIALLNNQLIPV